MLWVLNSQSIQKEFFQAWFEMTRSPRNTVCTRQCTRGLNHPNSQAASERHGLEITHVQLVCWASRGQRALPAGPSPPGTEPGEKYRLGASAMPFTQAISLDFSPSITPCASVQIRELTHQKVKSFLSWHNLKQSQPFQAQFCPASKD